MHTVIVSDIHLSEAEASDPRRPLWMAYKRRELFVDDDFARFLEWMQRTADGPIELVLNGDIFDFDNVTQLPEEPEGRVTWLAKARGLGSEEWMSRFKMSRIIADHPVWFGALRAFLDAGHRVVFVIGNHDLELSWPSVQQLVRGALGPANGEEQLRFCPWFYLSEGDTYVSHGHVYDPNCAVPDPIDPLIQVHGRPRVRIPFGDLAGRYMLNGMGYFNPHATDNYIMSGWDYVKFFFRYMLRTQPLLLWSWFWSALATLYISLRDHWKPPMRDPLLVEEKVAAIAKRSQATPRMVRQLAALNVPSSCTDPAAIIRELWLDRGFLFLGICFLAWQIILHVNIALPISPLWAFAALAVLFPPYLAYSAQVKSTVFATPLLDEERARLIHRITGARNVVMGHSHIPERKTVGPVEFTNGGFWSPAFADPECTQRLGTQTFVWLRADEEGRQPELYEWAPGAVTARRYEVAETKATRERSRGESPSVVPPATA
ncbi:MAG: metallophosphoesterase [Myxococcales bacterium]|nr:metallophosphoesterase [Myxococcales bacterium]